MIINLEYRNGKDTVNCNLIERIGHEAFILVRGENKHLLVLKVDFDLITVSSKYRIGKK